MFHVHTEGAKAYVTLLNIISSLSIQLEIGNTLLKVPIRPADNLAALALLRSGQSPPREPRLVQPQDQKASLTPEYIVAAFPFALANRVNEKQVGWESVDVTAELQGLIEDLDNIPIQTIHTVAMLYIPSQGISQVSLRSRSHRGIDLDGQSRLHTL